MAELTPLATASTPVSATVNEPSNEASGETTADSGASGSGPSDSDPSDSGASDIERAQAGAERSWLRRVWFGTPLAAAVGVLAMVPGPWMAPPWPGWAEFALATRCSSWSAGCSCARRRGGRGGSPRAWTPPDLGRH